MSQPTVGLERTPVDDDRRLAARCTDPTSLSVAGGRTNELRGTAASAGRASGAARVMCGPEDRDRLRAGDIIVCAAVTSAWTPLFSVAAGIITETGGLLSNSATIARECGIPVVLGVKGATARIRDGQAISIDGANGVVSPEL